MNRLIGIALMGVALLTAACTTTGEIEGYRIRADAQEVTVTSYNRALVRAPQWFKDYWGEYLQHAVGNYTVMALDRNLRGAFYVYCQGGGCHTLIGDQFKSHKDVQYKSGALKECRANALREYPGLKPDCEIFAIRDKIVWTGKMPWE